MDSEAAWSRDEVTRDEAAESAGSWETARMPSFEYDAWSTNLQDTIGGIECVRQCLRETRIVLPLLKKIASHDFFSYFAVNLITPCMYFPSGDAGCEMATCEIRTLLPMWRPARGIAYHVPRPAP